MPLFTGVRGETVWKIGTGTRSGPRRPLGGAEVESISRLLAARKHAREAPSYFPISFGREILGTSPKRRSRKYATCATLLRCVCYMCGGVCPVLHPGEKREGTKA